MIKEILMPKIGSSPKPLTVVEWKKQEGSLVNEKDIIVVVETEKIRYDIEASIKGYLHIVVGEKKESAIGSVIGYIAETEAEYNEIKSKKPAEEKIVERVVREPSRKPESTPSKSKAIGERIKISPLARKLAEEHVVDITSVKASGPEGRIVKEDIEQYLRAKEMAYDGKKIKEIIPLTGTRKAISEHMHRSLAISAQITLMGEIDAFNMVRAREKLLKQEVELGEKITYTDIFIYIISRTLMQFPLINASIIDDEIKVWEDINIGVAVTLEDGLIVPVVKNADKKSLVEISKDLKELAKKARERKLDLADVKGATFSITNLGAFGGGYRFETVIINQPESAILGTGGITERPVAFNNKIVIRPIMTYYFTYDHRLIDGALATKFIGKVKEIFESASDFTGVGKEYGQ